MSFFNILRPILIVLSLVWFLPATARFYKYNELQLKDLDQMRKAVLERVDKARELSEQATEGIGDGEEAISNAQEDEGKNQEAIELLRDGLRLVLSRPDTDNMVSKLMPLVHRPLSDYSAFKDSINLLVTESIHGLDQKKLNVEERATFYVILQNTMAELAPQLKSDADVKSIFVKIKKADIDMPADIVNHRRLSTMDSTVSPSETAQALLHRDFPKEFDKAGKPWFKFW